MTFGPHLTRLRSVASAQLARGPVPSDSEDSYSSQLRELLESRNGFCAFEGALHVRGLGFGVADLAAWNDENNWRNTYGSLAGGIFFFAEDLFGGQFGFVDGRVISFDPETGERAEAGASLENWAERLMADYEVVTGYPLAHEWQQLFGPLDVGHRLLPRVPFVLGGEYQVENLYSAEASEGMRVRGALALQLRDLPDGSPVRYRIVE